jgi:probable FeS assembly SUF system protein SufT
MFERETVTLTRDCEVTVVPAGHKVMLSQGAVVTITQTLGGTFSVVTDQGFMARVEARDADALGKPAEPESPSAPAAVPADKAELEQQVWDQLRSVYDPEIPVNIVDLGLVYVCRVEPDDGGYRAEVHMTMTAPGCGMGDVLSEDARARILSLPGVTEADVRIVWEPVWDQGRMSDAARLQLGMD